MTFEEWAADGKKLGGMELELARSAWDAATKAEREACAKVCDLGIHQVRENGWIDAANERARCAAAIRERSNAKLTGSGTESG